MFVSIANAKKEACFTEIHPTAYASLRGRGNSFCTLVKRHLWLQVTPMPQAHRALCAARPFGAKNLWLYGCGLQQTEACGWIFCLYVSLLCDRLGFRESHLTEEQEETEIEGQAGKLADAVTWKLDAGVLTISGSGKMTNYNEKSDCPASDAGPAPGPGHCPRFRRIQRQDPVAVQPEQRYPV